MNIRAFEESDSEQVAALWNSVWPTAKGHNAPDVVIDLKNRTGDSLFWVAVVTEPTDPRDRPGDVLGTIMAGYDGHRGWLYRMAVVGRHRNTGVGRQLVAFAEAKLRELGCVKVNLQIRPNDKKAARFYMSLGYDTEARISMGKIL